MSVSTGANWEQECVLEDIVAERKRQDKKWGVQDHSPLEWYAILGEEYGEVGQEVLRNHFGGRSLDDYEAELIQVAAVAVNALENLRRNRK